ncbi:hypothetical protein BH11PLA1_BH11PLA1_06000 [soil metagenome]
MRDPLSWAPFALAIFLCIDAAQQPPSLNSRYARTFIGDVAHYFSAAARRTGSLQGLNYFAARKTSSGWIVRDLAEDIRLAPEPYSPPEAMLVWNSRVHARGIWTPVSETKRDTIECESIPLTRADQTSIHAGLRAYDPVRFIPSRMAEDFAGGRTTHRILWLGVLNDAAVLAAFIGVWFTRHGLVNWFQWTFLHKRREPPPGICPRCGYDYTATSSAVCPECGQASGATP